MKKALVVWGGWDGHQPEKIARLCEDWLTAQGFSVEVSDSLSTFSEKGEGLKELDLIVPCWTMGKIEQEQLKPLTDAVESGVGLGGCHGGMGDSFRDATEYQFMVGGQWVSHPGNDGVTYTVNIRDHSHAITGSLPDFELTSEQYYMHVDPAVKVLATTQFPTAPGPHTTNGPVDMPVVWTKRYGQGKIFFCSLGHRPEDIASGPAAEIMKRGLAWAAKDAG